MDSAKSVTATFTRLTYNLHVDLVGSGEGSVTSSPPGISCETGCDQVYDGGTSVTLTAAPNGDSVFTGWSGDCTGTGTCTVTMDADKSVTATFAVGHDLNVAFAGTGAGTVTSDPAGISCTTDCGHKYAETTSVTLTATPAAGSRFGSWTGCDSTTDNECTVTMDADKSVTATFVKQWVLTVSKAGSGSGTVSSSPAGIDCGADCSETYDQPTVVTLTATPDEGSRFGSWTGCDSTTDNDAR